LGIVLIGGGARGGKSRFALEYAEQRFTRRAFIATAQSLDSEMAERIRRHQHSRGPTWKTLEAPLDLVGTLSREGAKFEIVVVDCLTLWLSNVLLDPDSDVEKEMDSLLRYLVDQKDAPSVVLVTNEVGSGIVPDNELARQFRDLAGVLNQRVAQAADEVYWMAFGIPMAVKTASGDLR
jgi:adenosylcobinamide kinase/adenosylcobinamide-phosphate guanylyltransferase